MAMTDQHIHHRDISGGSPATLRMHVELDQNTLSIWLEVTSFIKRYKGTEQATPKEITLQLRCKSAQGSEGMELSNVDGQADTTDYGVTISGFEEATITLARGSRQRMRLFQR